jgi:hypothetical protein
MFTEIEVYEELEEFKWNSTFSPNSTYNMFININNIGSIRLTNRWQLNFGIIKTNSGVIIITEKSYNNLVEVIKQNSYVQIFKGND